MISKAYLYGIKKSPNKGKSVKDLANCVKVKV